MVFAQSGPFEYCTDVEHFEVGGFQLLLLFGQLPTGELRPFGNRVAGFCHDGVGAEFFAEHGVGKAQNVAGSGVVAHGCGCRNGCHSAQRTPTVVIGNPRVAVRPVFFEFEAQPAQQHGHISALGTVIGVELIEHQVLQGQGAFFPQARIGLPQQQLVEHFVVGQQDVRRIGADGFADVDESVCCYCRPFRVSGFARVDGCADALELRVGGDHLCQTLRLVGSQGVHGVQDERADSCPARAFVAHHVVEDRVEERLRLTRARAGGHECGLRAFVGFEAPGGQAGEGFCLVAVGRVFAGGDVERIVSVRARFERGSGANIRPPENTRLFVREELFQGVLCC